MMEEPTYKETARMLKVFKEVLFNVGKRRSFMELKAWAFENKERSLVRACDRALLHFDAAEADLNRMCIGPYKCPVPPYESIWRSPEGTLNTKFGLAVETFYEKYEISSQGLLNEMPDFFGNELEFLFFLFALADLNELTGDHEAAEEVIRDARMFWANHLGHWAPPFLEAVRKECVIAFWAFWSSVLDKKLKQIFGRVPLVHEGPMPSHEAAIPVYSN